MGHTSEAVGPDLERAHTFLVEHLGPGVGDVELIGEGMWSRCFGFTHEGRELAVCFGRHVDDYEKDRRAASFASPALPVPRVVEIGPGLDDGWFAIAERAHGEPLEQLDRAGWRAVLPSLLAVFDALAAVDVAGSIGWGGWGPGGTAPMASWRDYLLAVGDDALSPRTAGRRQLLIDSPYGDAAFRAALARLTELSDAANGATRSLVHADLTNRNVLVDSGRITAVLDWGCSLYGDFLYELAWMEFWLPWCSAMVDADVVGAIKGHLASRDGARDDFDARLSACLLHIGLDHMAYNAWTGDMDDLGRVIDRTMEYVE